MSSRGRQPGYTPWGPCQTFAPYLFNLPPYSRAVPSLLDLSFELKPNIPFLNSGVRRLHTYLCAHLQ